MGTEELTTVETEKLKTENHGKIRTGTEETHLKTENSIMETKNYHNRQ